MPKTARHLWEKVLAWENLHTAAREASRNKRYHSEVMRFNAGLEINVESTMPAQTVQGLRELGHRLDVIDDAYQDFGAGQFIWRMGDPAVEGYLAASDPRRDGLAAGS